MGLFGPDDYPVCIALDRSEDVCSEYFPSHIEGCPPLDDEAALLTVGWRRDQIDRQWNGVHYRAFAYVHETYDPGVE